MEDMVDPLVICVYCGEVMNALTPQQEKMFGKPVCCGYDMLRIEREKIHAVVRAADKLKENLEAEVLKGVYDDLR